MEWQQVYLMNELKGNNKTHEYSFLLNLRRINARPFISNNVNTGKSSTLHFHIVAVFPREE